MLQCKCLRCVNLEIGQFADGIVFRCGKGFYDSGEHRQFFSPSGLVKGTNVKVWIAMDKCGNNFTPMRNRGETISFASRVEE